MTEAEVKGAYELETGKVIVDEFLNRRKINPDHTPGVLVKNHGPFSWGKDADNAVLDGIRITSTLIKQRRIKVIRENCPNFLREVNSYIWDEKGIQNGEERPLKENDHAMDAMRYLCKTIVNRRRLAL